MAIPLMIFWAIGWAFVLGVAGALVFNWDTLKKTYLKIM